MSIYDLFPFEDLYTKDIANNENVGGCDVNITKVKPVIKLKLSLQAQDKQVKTGYQSLERQFSLLSSAYRSRIVKALTVQLRSRKRSFKKMRRDSLFGLCDAKTSLGTICHRRCQSVLETYCQTHRKNPTKFNHIEKKEKTARLKIDVSQLDKSRYFEVKLIEIEGESLYIDSKGLLYNKRDYTLMGIQDREGNLRMF